MLWLLENREGAENQLAPGCFYLWFSETAVNNYRNTLGLNEKQCVQIFTFQMLIMT